MAEYFDSLYATTAAPGEDYPTLEGPVDCDVVIIGGGYTGLSAALHLAKAGLSAVVLEAETIGWGASGRNGGQVNPGLYPVPSIVLDRYGPDLGRRMLDFSYDAPNRVFDLVRRNVIDCDAAQTGTLRAAATATAEAAIEAMARVCADLGMPTQRLSASEMQSRTGTSRYRSALFDPRGGQINPLGYVRGLARCAASIGARIFTGSRTQALTRERGGGWRACTASGTVTARHAILCTNGYTDDLWPRLRQSVVPVFSAIVATEPLTPSLAATILPGREVLYEIGWNTVYYRLDASGRLLMGGRGPQHRPQSPVEFEHLREHARRLFPALKDVRWEYAWSGQVAVTKDKVPQLLDLGGNGHAALGYNGRGIAMATAMGGLLARRVAGEAPASLPMPVTSAPKAFAFHRFWPTGVATRILYGRLRDHLGR